MPAPSGHAWLVTSLQHAELDREAVRDERPEVLEFQDLLWVLS